VNKFLEPAATIGKALATFSRSPPSSNPMQALRNRLAVAGESGGYHGRALPFLFWGFGEARPRIART
jgi:hypothetical protein